MIGLFSFFSGRVGVAGFTPALRAELEPEGILAVAENVGVRQRFSGSVPGCHAASSISRHKGLVVFTRRRLYAVVPTMPRLKEPAIDAAWDGSTTGAAKVTVDESGVTLDIALGRVDARFSGELTTTWKTPLGDELRSALPTHTLRFEVSPAYVFSSLGVRVRP